MTTLHQRTAIVWSLAALAAVTLVLGLQLALRPAGEAPGIEAAEGSDAAGTVSFLMEQQWLIKMKLARVEEAMLAPQVTAVGRVTPAPRHHAVVAPPVDGVISGPPLPQLGQSIRQGDLIAVIAQTPPGADAAGLRLEQARLEAERRRLDATRRESQARLDFARAEQERAERLYERGAYSLRQLRGAETEFTAAAAALAALEAQFEALAAPTAVMNYEVRAPISGAVVSVGKRFGEQVRAGEVLLEIVDPSTVWVEAPVFERDLGRLEENPRAVFSTPALPGREFTSSRVIDAGDVIDLDTRAAMFVFETPNADGALRIGMQANLRLNAQEEAPTLVVPREAVLDHEGQKIVYVLLSGETFQRRTVTVGDEYGDRVAILSGLEAGQRVVTQGAYQLKLQELQPADPGAHTHEV